MKVNDHGQRVRFEKNGQNLVFPIIFYDVLIMKFYHYVKLGKDYRKNLKNINWANFMAP